MTCSTGLIIDQIADRWKLRLLHQLVQGAQRTQALLVGLEGISSRTLAAKLKALQAEGWIARQVFPEAPPRVEYELTEKGRALLPLLAVLKRTGETFFQSDEAGCPSCQRLDSTELWPERRPPHPIAASEPEIQFLRPTLSDDDVALL